MKTLFRQFLVSLLVLSIMPLGSPANGDCGSIPYRAPLELVRDIAIVSAPGSSGDVQFDPLKVVVYEPGQRGVILWNGEEEILLLSTEIKTSENVSILEVIPMPSEPKVRPGSFETFEKMQSLLLDKTMWTVAAGGGVADAAARKKAAKITFHEKMGAHDVSVVNVRDSKYFVSWVEDFLKARNAENPEIHPDFVKIIESYLSRNFEWFVFDVIEAKDKLQSREPIEYRFKTDSVFYPLEISTLETGKTNIDLLLVTKKKLTFFPESKLAVKRDSNVSLSSRELQGVSSRWAGFMGHTDMDMLHVQIKGDIRKMKTDFRAR